MSSIITIKISWSHFFANKIKGIIYIILNLSSRVRVCRIGSNLSNSFGNRLYGTLVFP